MIEMSATGTLFDIVLMEPQPLSSGHPWSMNDYYWATNYLYYWQVRMKLNTK